MTAPVEDPRGGEGWPTPTVEDIGYECDWGSCHGEATALRWNESGEGIVAWLPVCARHRTRASVSYDDLRPAAGRGDTDSGGEETPQPPECPTCGKRQWPVIHSCTGIPAARPAGDRAQPTQELREAIRDELGRYWDNDVPDWAVNAVLSRPEFAALLDAQAAVNRVRAALRAELTESGLVAPVHIATGKVYDALDGP